MKKRKLAFTLGMCFLAATLQIGCGGASKDSAATESAPMASAPMEEVYYEDNAMGMVTTGSSAEMKEMETADEIAEESIEEAVTEESGQAEVQTERKLIRTVDLNLETENYDALIEGLEQEINNLGGYIEYKDAYHGNYNSRVKGYRNRHANITARIPANKLDEFTGRVAEIGNITYESESVEDVTLQYVDLSSHKKMLQTEQERLMTLLENAESMEDIIAIESRLSEVRYQIESMESQLRTFDNQVDYSTVHINVEEVEHYTPQPEKTTWERIKSGFLENVYRVTNGIKNFAIEFVIAIPVLVVWAVVITVGVIVIRVVLKKKHKRNVEKVAKKQELFQNENVSEESNKK
ncbi:MAG: DUF4349 domain-containing protein [Lachnospiraceae bacterium]|nr:DUF4349 domain-containing protein [Lachnospiraceae bacterium]